MFCIETDPGVFEENIVQKCKTPDETCLLDRCALEPNPKCPAPNGSMFVCTGTGVFPDPFDCSSYHVCIEKSQIISDENVPVNDLYAAVKCPENWGYNPVTTYCDKRLSDGFCPEAPPIPTCQAIGNIGAITGTSIYYICTTDNNGVLRPILHMCPHGNVIDGNGKCQEQKPPETTTIPTLPSTTQTSPPPPPPPPTSPPPPPPPPPQPTQS